MTSSQVDIYSFDVFFEQSNKHVTVPGLSQSNPLHTTQGLSLITFSLDNLSGAEFATDPIQWLQDGEPAALPPWFVLHRHDAWHFALWAFNSAPQTTRHDFELSVFYTGQFYSTSDPSIVYDPPSG